MPCIIHGSETKITNEMILIGTGMMPINFTVFCNEIEQRQSRITKYFAGEFDTLAINIYWYHK